MKQLFAYWQQPVFLSSALGKSKSRTHVQMLAALLASLAAILQMAGGAVPGIGYVISPFATLPIVIVSYISLSGGFFSYVLTIGLLFMLQPGELFIFPFTTGLLGLAIGFSVARINRRLPVVLLSGTALFAGISFVTLLLRFPLFGPESQADPATLLLWFGFSLIYSYIWVEISRFFLRRLFPV